MGTQLLPSSLKYDAKEGPFNHKEEASNAGHDEITAEMGKLFIYRSRDSI